MMKDEIIKENKTETSIEELKMREMFGYDTVWHLVGKFDQKGYVHYEEQMDVRASFRGIRACGDSDGLTAYRYRTEKTLTV